MKALSLTQPWASLVAIGEKKIETRSWSSSYRGPLAIHAAKSFPIHAKELILMDIFRDPLRKAGIMDISDLPLGCVIATCTLMDIVQVQNEEMKPPIPEWCYGDFSIGRYMWYLDNISILPKPIPAKGALSLWDWNGDIESHT